MAKELRTPLSEKDIGKLKLGESVYLSGTVYTARDKVHQRIIEEGDSPVDLSNGVIFHCGPLLKKIGSEWRMVALGPTTSSRMNRFSPEIIRKYGIKAIIGKGGMDENVARAMKGHKAVYLAMTGGCSALGAETVKKVDEVKWFELGMAEALWILEVERLGPLVVAIDSRGNSIYEKVGKKVKQRLASLL